MLRVFPEYLVRAGLFRHSQLLTQLQGDVFRVAFRYSTISML